MDGRRRAPDRRSPVQPGKTGIAPFIILAVVAAGAAWTSLHDSGIGSFDVPNSASSGLPGNEGAKGPQSARGSVAALFSPGDYPEDALRNGEQGTVGVQLTIDERGRVSRCDVIQSSNSSSLDSATCRVLQERAHFTPAHDSEGRPVVDTYSQRITWRL